MLRKMLPKLFLLFTFVFLTIACSSTDKVEEATPGPELDQTTWVMASIETPTGEQFLGIDLRSVTITFKDGSVSGSSGCNSFGSTYTAAGSEISISAQMMQTLMACADIVMNLETAVTQGLLSVDSYSVEAGKLVLTGAGYRLVYEPQS